MEQWSLICILYTCSCVPIVMTALYGIVHLGGFFPVNELVGLVGQVDPEGLEVGIQSRAVTRATARSQFTEAGMSWVMDSHSES